MSLILALMLQAVPAPCPTRVPPPAALSGWTTPLADTGEALTVGRAYRVRLGPAQAVRFAAVPEKPAAAESRAAVRSFIVTRAGLYRVALDSGLWVDVVQGGRAMPSATHGHGPDCSGVRKMVDYRLTPGRYVLQLSGGRAEVATAMVARVG